MYIKHYFDNNLLPDLHSKHSSRLEHGFATTSLTVYALDTFLDLSESFFLNQLHHAMKAPVLATAHEDFIGRV